MQFKVQGVPISNVLQTPENGKETIRNDCNRICAANNQTTHKHDYTFLGSTKDIFRFYSAPGPQPWTGTQTGLYISTTSDCLLPPLNISRTSVTVNSYKSPTYYTVTQKHANFGDHHEQHSSSFAAKHQITS